MGIGERIKKIRKEKGLSQKELGQLLDVSQQMIGQYEAPNANLKLDTLKKIANALEVSWLDLMNTAENLVESSASTLTDAAENIGETISDFSNGMRILPKDEQTLISDYQKLNNTGKKEARKRVNELTEIPRYTNKDGHLPDNKD